jgi:hypothetical protein
MEMADVILIFIAGESDRFDDDTLAATFAATNIERQPEGVLACTVPASMVLGIERHPAVAYVRRVQAYLGSYDA